MDHTLSFLSLNVNSCRDSLKRFSIFTFLKTELKSDFYLLQDTQTTLSSETVWRLTWRGKIYFSHSPSSVGGLAILVRPGLSFTFLKLIELIPGRALILSFSLNDQVFYLLNVYAPSKGEARRPFFSKLFAALKELFTPDDFWCLAGDFNCTLNPSIDRTAKHEHHPSSAAVLQQIVDFFSFVDSHVSIHGEKKLYTWSNAQGSASRLDKYYILDQFRPSVLTTECHTCFLSDHKAVILKIQTKKVLKNKPLWKLDVNLLDDPDYIDLINNFWGQWQNEKRIYNDILIWWEMGKIKIRQLTQQFSAYRRNQQRAELSFFQRELVRLEDIVSKNASAETISQYNNAKQQIHVIQKNRLYRPLTNLHHQFLTENDACTSFFFQKEKSKNQQKYISHLKMGDDNITDPKKIRQEISTFYSDLYSPDPIDHNIMFDVCSKVLPLTESLANILERPITINEISDSISQQSNKKTPGIDGIPADFYKIFKPIIVADLLEVYNTSLQKNLLPTSMRRAIITLLPKKGDLGLIKNWRPVSILCGDYKILTKVIVNRLKPFLQNIIHKDQTYCIPGRTIHHNIHLLRDTICLANMENTPLALINIDQMKAFDRVNHQYLFQLLKNYNFGPFFRSLIGLVYSDPVFLVKVNNFLSSARPFARGLRQGCSLSAALYALALEPLLNMLRVSQQIEGLVLSDHNIKISAYADDVTLIVTSNSAWTSIAKTFSRYEAASNAKINFEKSKGLWCGSWKNRRDSPLNMVWSSEPLKLLGIFLGNSHITELNFAHAVPQVKKILNAWAPIAKALSYRGRTLVINQICAPLLWHRFSCLSPPAPLLLELRRLFVSFFWQGCHWTSWEFLSLPLDQGGQGLIHLEARIFDFRLTFLRTFLDNLDKPIHSCFLLTRTILHRIYRLNYDYQLFLYCSSLPLVHCPYLDIFYSSFLKLFTKQMFLLQTTEKLTVELIKQKSILYDPAIPIKRIQLSTESFIAAGFTTIGDLLKPDYSFISPIYFQDKMQITSNRIATLSLKKLIACIPLSWIQCIQQAQRGNINNQDFTDFSTLFSIKYTDTDTVQSVPVALYKRRAFYCFYLSCYTPDKKSPKIKWDYYDSDVLDYNFFLNTYVPPNEKRNSDIQWRFLYQSFFPRNKLFQLQYEMSPLCLFCNEVEDHNHIFSTCPRLQTLFHVLKIHMQYVYSDTAPPYWWYYGPPYVKSSRKMRTINWLIISAKAAIWITRGHKLQNKNPTDVYRVYLGLVQRRLQSEFRWHSLHKTVHIFKKRWCYNTYFYINHDQEVVLKRW